MRSLLALAALVAAGAAPAPEEHVDTVTQASPGAIRAQLGLDFLRVSSSNDAGAAAGEPETLAAHEAGMRLLVHVDEFDETLTLDVDYQGREPIGGDVDDTALRLLYRAELTYRLLPGTLSIALGRYVAPSVNLLVVDGARAHLTFGPLTISPFGGRRAITTSRRNVDLGDFVPAAGVGLTWRAERWHADAAFTYSRDIGIVAKGETGEYAEELDAAGGYAGVTVRPFDELIGGARVAFTQRASYLIGPAWSTIDLEVQALDLWQGHAFLEYRPVRWIRLGYNFHTQSTGVFRADFMDPTLPDDIEPRFTDNEAAIGVLLFDRVWIRPKARHRIRPDRTELRLGGTIDADDLGIQGLFARAFFAFEDVSLDSGGPPDLDRIVGSGSAGYRADFGLEVEAGVSYIDRAQGPLSARVTDAQAPIDLAPFVLEAQRFAFARAFYADERWFGGLDVEANLEDLPELRVFVQAGVVVEASW